MPWFYKKENDASDLVQAPWMKIIRADGNVYAEVPRLYAADMRTVGWTSCFGPEGAPTAPSAPPPAPTPAPAIEKAVEAAPAPQPEPEPEPVEDADTDVLDLNSREIRKSVRAGDCDGNLQALLDAENAGKTRSSVVDELERRMEAIA